MTHEKPPTIAEIGEQDFASKTSVIREWINDGSVEVPEMSKDQVLEYLAGDLETQYNEWGNKKVGSPSLNKPDTRKTFFEEGIESDTMKLLRQNKELVQAGDIEAAEYFLREKIGDDLAVVEGGSPYGPHLSEEYKNTLHNRLAVMLTGRDMLKKELQEKGK